MAETAKRETSAGIPVAGVGVQVAWTQDYCHFELQEFGFEEEALREKLQPLLGDGTGYWGLEGTRLSFRLPSSRNKTWLTVIAVGEAVDALWRNLVESNVSRSYDELELRRAEADRYRRFAVNILGVTVEAEMAHNEVVFNLEEALSFEQVESAYQHLDEVTWQLEAAGRLRCHLGPGGDREPELAVAVSEFTEAVMKSSEETRW